MVLASAVAAVPVPTGFPAEAYRPAAPVAPMQAPSARYRAILCLSLMSPYQIRPMAFFTALAMSAEVFHFSNVGPAHA
jgi:hypothetical protein